MTVLVDADSCPVPIRELLCRAGDRRGVAVQFLANRPLQITPAVNATVVEGHSVDDEILARVDAPGPFLVVTRDIPLAETLVNRGITVMNDRGTVFDAASVRERRSMRDAAEQIRAAGLESMSRRRTFGARERKAFADALDRLLTRAMG